MKIIKDPFLSTMTFAFIGGVSGIVAAIIFTYLIVSVASTLGGGLREYAQGGDVYLIPGMAVGVIVGSILGGIAGLRRTK